MMPGRGKGGEKGKAGENERGIRAYYEPPKVPDPAIPYYRAYTPGVSWKLLPTKEPLCLPVDSNADKQGMSCCFFERATQQKPALVHQMSIPL